jgi:glycerol uptake facilitator protein
MANRLWPELIAEALGTFLIVMCGTGVVAMVVLFGSGTQGEIINGGYTNITIGWGLAVAMAIYLTARVSGAHLNPAVTVALACFRGFPVDKIAPYCLAQIVGAFFGAMVTYINYRPAFLRFDPALSKSAGVFTTFPAFPDVLSAGFLDQTIGTFLLVLLVFALTDEENLAPPAYLGPLLVGLVVVLIGMTFGAMHGYAINPARDLGPRLFTALAGFQNTGFNNGVFLVPIAGPLLGGVLGGAAYDVLIGKYLPKRVPEGVVDAARAGDPR